MIRYNVFLRESQLDFLSNLDGSTAEHIRRALDEYIAKKKSETINVSLSPSINQLPSQ